LRKLSDELVRAHPSITNPNELIARGGVVVDGRLVINPASLVRKGAAISLKVDVPLRGEAKLTAALTSFSVDVRGRVALDVGAAAGGFTRVLLKAGARRVYSVDAGHGQLVGSLRQDPRVVNLEATNLGTLNLGLVPDTVDVVTLDLSYLALRDAVPQLGSIRLDDRAHAIALLKPQFELGLREPPQDRKQLLDAVDSACNAFDNAGWTSEWTGSPVRGRRGAIEFLLHATRQSRIK
jgi:23S rRNA (cytidine1920-2'-O)/16S rRNA (cytidine1409-2'-O)-methyltransferase